jgi:histidinol dehydrogenase
MWNIAKCSMNLAYSEGLEAHALPVKTRLEEE